MNRKLKTILVISVLAASSYTGYQSILWGQSMLRVGETRIMCRALGQRLLDSPLEEPSTSKKPSKTAQQFAQVVQFIDKECWAKH
jgi:hypothetical protein